MKPKKVLEHKDWWVLMASHTEEADYCVNSISGLLSVRSDQMLRLRFATDVTSGCWLWCIWSSDQPVVHFTDILEDKKDSLVGFSTFLWISIFLFMHIDLKMKFTGSTYEGLKASGPTLNLFPEWNSFWEAEWVKTLHINLVVTCWLTKSDIFPPK